MKSRAVSLGDEVGISGRGLGSLRAAKRPPTNDAREMDSRYSAIHAWGFLSFQRLQAHGSREATCWLQSPVVTSTEWLIPSFHLPTSQIIGLEPYETQPEVDA